MKARVPPVALIAMIACLALAQVQAATDLRVALVIGNAAYTGAPLTNPANDAKAMSAALKGLGFTVIELRDASKAQMQAAVAQASGILRGRHGVGLLYYAGHGLQLDWRNYMVPVDARLHGAADVREQTVEIQSVIDAFRVAGNRMSIVVLDACRDNPFADSATGKGLAQMDAPQGTLLAYATAPGNVAEDGDADGGNGLYTRYLVHELKQPGAKIEDVFKRVRLQVRKQSAGRQIPWESTSLEDDFYFDPKVKVMTLADAERALEDSEVLAREKSEWARIGKSIEPADFMAFLEQYPKGMFSLQAQSYLDELRQLHARAKPGVAVALPDVRNRYATGDTLEYERIDGYTKLVTPVVARVTFADNELVEINKGQIVLTQQGGVLRDALGRNEPERLDFPADLTGGKKWRSAYTTQRSGGSKVAAHCDYEVVALEDVTVPAGTFKAFKVEKVCETSSAGLLVSKGTTWIDPTTMLNVRIDTLTRMGGRIQDFDTLRLVSVKRAVRRAAAEDAPQANNR